MAHRNGKVDKKKLNTQRAAHQWLDQGILTVPLKPSSKKPKGGKGWNKLLIEEETVERYFSPGDNIGGLWGEPSGWIVDIDLDWDEACEVAPYLLPDTFAYGRADRPYSHYLFRCREVSTSKWRLRPPSRGEDEDEKLTVVELRSTGAQSVLPPSWHPDGDQYEINGDLPIKEISQVELKRMLDSIAGAAVLVRYFPQGGRHDYIHAITGALMHSGWNEKRVKEFMTAILSATQDQDDESDQRVRTVRNSIENFKQGNRIQGWPTLGQWLEGRYLQACRQWLTPKVKFEKPPPNPADLEESSRRPELIFDKHLASAPGLVGQIAEWARKQSYYLQPSFDLAAGLMCTALASSNHYTVSHWDTPLQPYFMLLAPTGTGKDAALQSVMDFSGRISMDPYVFQGFQSFYALMDRLAEPPGIVCWLWDEIARHLTAAKATSSQDYTTISHMISIYGKGNRGVPAMPGRKNDIPALERPFLTLMGAAQPAQLMEAISQADITTGFLNRLVLFDSGDGVPEVNRNRSSVFPSAIRRQAINLKKHEPRHQTTEIQFGDGAYPFFRDFEQYATEQGVKGRDHEIWSRANQNALIVAGIVAVGINEKRPLITQEIADWSVALITWGIKCWMARIQEDVTSTYFQKQSRSVEKMIRNPRAMVDRAKRDKEKTFLKRGEMPRSMLTRCCGLKARELDEVLEILLEGETIGISEDDNGFRSYWPKG